MTNDRALMRAAPALTLVTTVVALLAIPVRGQTPTAPKGDADTGKKLYVEKACWQCHGLEAQGGGIAGPRLAGRLPAWPAFSRYVRKPTEEMIPYTEKAVSDGELADIYTWLRAIPPPPPVKSLPQLNR